MVLKWIPGIWMGELIVLKFGAYPMKRLIH